MTAEVVSRGRPVLEAAGLYKRFPNGVQAVNGVDLKVEQGEIVGIVGESGCGKSTLVRLIMRIAEADSGSVIFGGVNITGMPESKLRRERRRFQLVPQNPATSLNSRLKVGESVGFNLKANGWSRRDANSRIAELFDLVGLPSAYVERYPHELSGGQIQRIAIARALATKPELIVCDEAVSALDKSVQAQILNLIVSLQEQLKLAVIFVSHDLEVIEHISDRVAVMYLGRVVETGPVESVMAYPAHPYTRALLAAIPGEGHRTPALTGEPPSPVNPPPGCPFLSRCPDGTHECASYDNLPVKIADGRQIRCLKVIPG
jgi:oligopeptide/dipeptide ABC transporter ATP-binding protein